ncbi:hypothetical protein P7H06_19475 [Paenibacillus larvae]|nr:hypothetical protein [Paenibacillus larvae]MDT2261236.1 hypothetical protein [Paenibacillus larvae]
MNKNKKGKQIKKVSDRGCQMNDMSNNLSGLTRVSEDSLGKVEIPEKAYFGPQTSGLLKISR